MSTVHFILQGKGGVGKSVIAALLAQYLHDKNMTVRCVDADPLNKTLAGFEALKVAKVDLLEKSERGGERIDPHRFDELVELVAAQGADSHVIVDAGSSAFIALVHYIVTNEVVAVLTKSGHEVIVHTLVTGGQMLRDTLHGAYQLVGQIEGVRFVVWLNPFLGPVAADGKTFEQMKAYQDVKKRIEAVISLPAFTDELFPQDIASMLADRLTFKEAIGSPAFTLMSRHRLTKAQSEFYSCLDSLAV